MQLITLVVLVAVAAVAAAAPAKEERALVAEQLEREALEQARNAKYSYETHIDDGIADQSQHRSEVRDGLSTRGSFSYSDGYLRRNVEYVSDEGGFKVLKDEVEPLAGPKENPEGTASVRTVVDGQEINYSVHSVPE
ncbi:uncharacterized protein LOC124590857 [Schistocerca americana]|uniref:uncharacterized protein LOC124590857 n=1 Tax=Schistocerca americana TaxID=7009 RepID=UPI001F4FF9F3|nr:uncharacterized protein LOC124590857 [Schistocerca americana]